jgi:uncharacterized protein (DUF885 family)
MRATHLALTMLCLHLGLTGCSSAPPTPRPADASVTRQFESAIANKILSDVRNELGEMTGAMRNRFLDKKLRQFENSVDMSQINQGIMQEYELLQFLASQPQASAQEFSYRMKALTTLPWTIAEYESQVLGELDRINQTITALAAPDLRNGFSLQNHLQEVRRSAQYPSDSFEGRQRYLDQVAEAMFDAQVEWHGILADYQASGLGITGTEDPGASFVYDDNGLTINLNLISALPDFEIKCIAAYYGFPGAHSISATASQEPLQSLLRMPAYTFGWAGYILDYIGTRDIANTLDYLYFNQLMTALAVTDLGIHTGSWTRLEASNYLTKSTAYTSARIEQMLDQLTTNPGFYLAGVAGKLKLIELQSDCLNKPGRDCDQAFHQQIVDLGPLPFELLERRLFQ